MSAAFFHGLGQKKASKQKEDEGMSVLFSHYLGFEDPEEWEEGKRKKGGDGDGYGLEDPPKGRPQSDSEGNGRVGFESSEFPDRPTDQSG